MSSLEEIKEQIQKAQADIETLENNSVEMTNNNYIWERRLKRLDDELKSLRETLRYKEEAELLLLRQRQSDSERERGNLHLYDLLRLVPSKINDTNTKKSGSTASKATRYVNPVYLFKWPNFRNQFENFQTQIKATSEKQNKRVYSKPKFYARVSAGSEISTQDFHKTFLNKIFEEQIYFEKNLLFGPYDNGTKVNSDIYWKYIETPQEEPINHFFSEVKSQSALALPMNVDDLISKYNSEIPMTNAIKQVITYSTVAGQIFAILTNHEVTYCFRINEEADQKGKTVARVYVSDPISRDEQFMAVFFILLLRYPGLKPNGFEECIENALLGVTNDFKTHINQGRLNREPKSNKGQKRKHNGQQQPNRQEHSDYTKLELDIYKHYKDDAEVFFANENYVLAKYVSNGKEFVIKCCDLFNSTKEARDEIRNEMEILEFINNELVTKSELRKFFPAKKYVGTIGVFLMIVIDYIDGKCYDEFGDMSDKVKMACRRSIEQLHKLGIAHGDIRAPNFIIRNFDTDPVAVVIDFGRSEIVKNARRSRHEVKKMLEKEFKQFCLDLDPISSQDSDEKYVLSDQSMNFKIQEYEYEQISQAVDCI